MRSELKEREGETWLLDCTSIISLLLYKQYFFLFCIYIYVILTKRSPCSMVFLFACTVFMMLKETKPMRKSTQTGTKKNG